MSTITEMKPFSVVNGKYLFWFTPSEEGGFTVSCQNVNGVNAEGDTFEEAMNCAVSMAKMMEEYHHDKRDEKVRATITKKERVVTKLSVDGKRLPGGGKQIAPKRIFSPKKK
ncbi:MAG: hypothetical protein LIP23_01525 [Planctomycetes bacterium]|nr:hypothetical protein [Planctomycetota bacterium]